MKNTDRGTIKAQIDIFKSNWKQQSVKKPLNNAIFNQIVGGWPVISTVKKLKKVIVIIESKEGIWLWN